MSPQEVLNSFCMSEYLDLFFGVLLGLSFGCFFVAVSISAILKLNLVFKHFGIFVVILIVGFTSVGYFVFRSSQNDILKTVPKHIRVEIQKNQKLVRGLGILGEDKNVTHAILERWAAGLYDDEKNQDM